MLQVQNLGERHTDNTQTEYNIDPVRNEIQISRGYVCRVFIGQSVHCTVTMH